MIPKLPLIMTVLVICLNCAGRPFTYTKQPLASAKNIAILPFADFREPNNSGQLLTNLFTIHFLDQGFMVAEREKINQLIKEKGLELAGISQETAKQFGTILNVNYILIGAVTDYTSYSCPQKFFYLFEWIQVICSVGVTARLVDTKTGEIIWVGIGHDTSYSFKEAAEEVAQTLFKSISIKP